MDRMHLRAEQLNRANKKRGRRKMWLSALSLIVVASTVAALMLPAFTLEKTTYCGLEEHTHDESCYTRELICPLEESEEHTHTDECYGEKTLTCGLEEHVHTLSCYSNPDAVESEGLWTAAFPVLDGTAAENAAAIAASQLGYRESAENYRVLEDGTICGYTRYGDWAGDPCGDWNTAFAAFCLRYAGAGEDTIPFIKDCGNWAEQLRVSGLFVSADAEDFVPQPGDILFSDTDGDGIADRVGIVQSADESGLRIIEGDWEDCVAQRTFPTGDAQIIGFGVLPESMRYTENENSGDPSAKDGDADKKDLPAQSFYAELDGLTVTVEADAGAFPANTVMTAGIVPAEQVIDAVDSALEDRIVWVQAVDICFFDADGNEIQPLIPIRVSITSDQIAENETESTEVVHVDDDGEAQVLEQAEDEKTGENEVVFETDSFSIYAVVGTVIEKTVLASDGNNYRITVSFGADAGVPEGAELEVAEIDSELDPEAYAGYAAGAAAALGMEAENAAGIRLFDISIVDADRSKVIVAAPVDVRIELAQPDREETAGLTRIVHFADGAQIGDVVANVEITQPGPEEPCRVLSFAAEGFSVYAIVDAPAPVSQDPQNVQFLNELADNTGKKFCLSYNSPPKYFQNTLNGSNALTCTTAFASAAEWTFEPVPGGGANQYYISTIIDGQSVYLVNSSGNDAGFSNSPDTAYELSDAGNGLFYIKIVGEDKWLQYSGSGSGIRFYPANNNATNPKIRITYAPAQDAYGLDGKSFGIAYTDGSTQAVALTADAITAGSQNRLEGQDLHIRPDILDNDGNLLVAEGTYIRTWTFEAVEGNKYRLYTFVNGYKKYLSFNGANVSLVDPSDTAVSVIQMTPGTGSNAGKWHFTVNGRSLNMVGKAFNTATGSGATTWLNLVTRTDLTDGSFKLYNAQKISVSDTVNLYDGQQVILYTRIWNDSIKKYEFFVVDHDGTLIPAYDAGDGIEWIGRNVNTALWDFTEYHYSDGTPNYYYELQNTQYKDYIAPQVTGEQILSPSKIGINLNGRRYGESVSSIIAWDDIQYAYSGLKVENGRVVSCSLSEAEDFYFAIVHEADVDDRLSTVSTVDSEEYGITMRMVDFNNTIYKDRDSVQMGFFSYDETNQSGLLSTNLNEDGYPTATSLTNSEGHPLSELFTGMTTVNHLFIESTYNESGYFEYDSTQNFAHLNADGTFTVYDQLGAITGVNERKATRVHGQFMPYNDIHEGVYAYDKDGVLITNETDVLAHELPDTNPRKGEKLYLIGHTTNPETDYFFGMEMTANFTKSANGLDAWGHDIIFEFSGDDDFWFYVDGELILDLGGVHSAENGSINFRTGDVKSTRVNTTLYDLFRSNYEARGMSEAEISAKLEELFEEKEVDGRTVRVFKDYSRHTMKMFYMERGAGASNLHMRFNLAAVKPGTVVLSKKLSGTDNESNKLIEFPYQIWYKTQGSSDYQLLEEMNSHNYNVMYKDTVRNVTYVDNIVIGGNNYSNVFFLKPGESAVITLPDDTVDYYIVECGVNTEVYDQVSANGTVLSGTNANGVRKDFATGTATTEERPTVEYDNHVKEGSMRTLSITKWLYDENGGDDRLYYPEDTTPFNLRIYLGNEFVSSDSLSGANLYTYYVKDGDGNYCRWDAGEQCFVSLGITDFGQLKAYLATVTPLQKDNIVFVTSMNGSVTKIPADHTAEIRDLIVGTQFKVEERDYEIPRGYTMRLSDGYQRVDEGHYEVTGTTPITGTIEVNDDPEIVVSNEKGWGLTIQKIWSDKDFMTSHDDIYFAVFLPDEQGHSTVLVDGTVRRLSTSESEIYYFFDHEQMSEHTFDDYVVREVVVVPPAGEQLVVDSNGVVTNYASVTPINDTLESGGVPVGGEQHYNYEYSVTYITGEQTTSNENVRTDTAINSRPGIRLVKTDWSWDALEGVIFKLTDDQGNDMAAETYTSDAEGLITIAYLGPGTYYLTEIETPKGYVALDTPLTITVGSNDSITVSGPDETYYTVDDDPEHLAVITIRNRQVEFNVIKVDGVSGDPLAGVHFALYPQVTDVNGNKIKDVLPMTDYYDLVTGADGVVPQVDLQHLRPGTYYLTETAAVGSYEPLTEDVCFTISEDGHITIAGDDFQSWLSETTDDTTGKTSFLITIPNKKMVKISLVKVDISNTDRVLPGAEFNLYRLENGVRPDTPMIVGLISQEDGYLEKNGERIFELPVGVYHLMETNPPSGYQLKTDPIVITVSSGEDPNAVTYDEGTNLSSSGLGKSFDSETCVYTLKISNAGGYELPHTGGTGALPFRVGGAALILTGLVLRFRRRKRERGDAIP